MRISCGLWVLLAAVGLFGCSGTGSSGSPAGGGGNGATAGTAGAGGVGATGGGGSAGSGGGPIDASSSDAPPAGKAAVFGHGPATLYKLDPNTLQVQTIGPFSGCTDVWDIALDKDSNMFATTETGLWRIDPDTAVCQLIASGGPFPNSLSFVPAGSLDPNAEALVGYEQTDYVRIDPTTGSIQTIKAGALTGGMVSSGDIVSVIGGKTFLTVKQGPCADSDCLIEIDPKTGSAIGNLGNVNQKGVFGLGFWAGRAYGFTNTGVLFEITLSSSGLTTTAINVPGAPVDLKFWGAGSTTAAPPDPT